VIVSTTTTTTTATQQHYDDNHHHQLFLNWVDNRPATKPFPFFCIHSLVPCSLFDTLPHLVTSHCPWSPQLTLEHHFYCFQRNVIIICV